MKFITLLKSALETARLLSVTAFDMGLRSTSSGVCIFQPFQFARASSHVADLNTRKNIVNSEVSLTRVLVSKTLKNLFYIFITNTLI